MTSSLVFTFSVLALSLPSFAAPLSEWTEFQQNTKSYMTTSPALFDEQGRPVATTKFSPSEIQSGAFIEQKYRLRKMPKTRLSALETNATMAMKLRFYFDRSDLLTNIEDLAKPEAMTAQARRQPWSGGYWPLYQGGPAARYATGSFERDWGSWKESQDSYQSEGDLSAVLAGTSAVSIDELSPSEKYDLLIDIPSTSGNSRGHLTTSLWNSSSQSANSNGDVETWMGYCHGWAPAALYDARPRRTIQAKPLQGAALQFYPSDVKALSTLLWANGEFEHRSLGGRCGSKSPKTDPETGRLLDPNCFDVNPGLWHLLVVNQMGQMKNGFVIDATYDYQVWNQPVLSYSYSFFNPQTGEPADRLEQAVVAKADYTKDKFKRFRGPKSQSMVGVQMTLQYIGETQPSHDAEDTEQNDRVISVTYLYDLELDSNGTVVGGEWYRNAHPDFVWSAVDGSHAVSNMETSEASGPGWNPSSPLPRFWRDIAVKSADAYGQPVAKIVDALVAASAEAP